MRSLVLPLVAIAAVSLAATLPPLVVAIAEGTAFVVHADQDDTSFFFRWEGVSGKNPRVAVPVGETITVTFDSVAGFHNFRVEGSGIAEYRDKGEGSTTYEFSLPSIGSFAYWCDPHRVDGMSGVVVAQAPLPPGVVEAGVTDRDVPGIPAVGVWLASAAAALLAAFAIRRPRA